MGSGGLAEQVAVRAGGLLAVPEPMTATQAACVPVNYCTTWYALHERAKLQVGETMLVHAGAGGIGSSAIQLGQAMGATIFATAGGPEKKAVLEKLGVDLAIDYLSEDFVEVVKERTDGQGVDVIYDPVGGDTWDRSRKVIGWDGRMLVIGFTSGRIPDHPTNHVLLKNYSVVGVHWGASVARFPDSVRQQWDALCDLFAEGGIDPLVFREVPFEEVPAALTLLANRGTWGKVVVTP
jgi:NADPH2:quinone reductase